MYFNAFVSKFSVTSTFGALPAFFMYRFIRCVNWLSQRYYRAGEEWAYGAADALGGRAVLIEPVLRNPGANPAYPQLAADVKCYTFAGKTRVYV